MPPMTEPEATPRRATLPDDPDELADLIAKGRTTILQLQNLARVFGPADTDTRGTLGDPAELEALADYLLVMQRAAMETLFAHCARAPRAGELSPALVRHALVALNAEDTILARFGDHPEEMTHAIAAVMAGPLPLDVKLARITRGEDGEAGAPRPGHP